MKITLNVTCFVAAMVGVLAVVCSNVLVKVINDLLGDEAFERYSSQSPARSQWR